MNGKKSMLQVAVAALTLAGLAVPARAQDNTGAPATPPPTAPAETTSTRSAGSPAAGSFGVGASAFLSGIAGPHVVYDLGGWHIEGLLAFTNFRGGGPNTPRQTLFDVGVSAWWHLHQGSSTDFSLGGGVGFISLSGDGDGTSAVAFEPGVLVRWFATPNLALHGRVGLSMVFGDNVGGVNEAVSLGAHLVNSFGFTYFFR